MGINVIHQICIRNVCLLLCLLGSGAWPVQAATSGPNAGASKERPLLSERFAALIKSDPALVEYWALNGNLLGATKALVLKTTDKDAVFGPGPFANSKSIDLASGDAIHVDPSPALGASKLAIEMIFMVPSSGKRPPGEGCLLGIRDGKDGRFSIHYQAGSYFLTLWNGNDSFLYEGDFCLAFNQWYHLAVSISDQSVTLWINGKKCRAVTPAGLGPVSKALPLVVGADDRAGKGEYAGIRVCHLAVYNGLLNDNSVANRIKALGWPDPNELNDAEKVDRRIAAFTREHPFAIYWKFNPSFIPAANRDKNCKYRYMTGSQASVAQANMLIGMVEKLFNTWPPEATRHLKGVYIFDWVEIMVRGVSMGQDGYLYMSSNSPPDFLQRTIFHESSHIVSETVPIDRKLWESQMAKGAHYLAASNYSPPNFDPNGTSEQLYKQGFLTQYNQVNLDEDFAVLADHLFMAPKELKALMKKYPEIRKKGILIINYFRKVSAKFDFSDFDDVIKGGIEAQDPAPGGAKMTP